MKPTTRRNPMKNIRGKWALITGASTDSGAEFADILASQGANLVLSARRTEPLERIAADLRRQHGVDVIIEAMDPTAPDQGEAIKARLDKRNISVDILINNTEQSLLGDFMQQPLGTTVTTLQSNLANIANLTRVFADDMAKRGGGYVLLVSLAGFAAMPMMAAYSAFRTVVQQFGLGLQRELAARNVRVDVLQPLLSGGLISAAINRVPIKIDRLVPGIAKPLLQRVGLRGLFADDAKRPPLGRGTQRSLQRELLATAVYHLLRL